MQQELDRQNQATAGKNELDDLEEVQDNVRYYNPDSMGFTEAPTHDGSN